MLGRLATALARASFHPYLRSRRVGLHQRVCVQAVVRQLRLLCSHAGADDAADAEEEAPLVGGGQPHRQVHSLPFFVAACGWLGGAATQQSNHVAFAEQLRVASLNSRRLQQPEPERRRRQQRGTRSSRPKHHKSDKAYL